MLGGNNRIRTSTEKIESMRAKPTRDKERRKNAFPEINECRHSKSNRFAKKTEAKAKREKEKRNQIAERVQAGSFFRIQIFGARYFAVATVKNAMDLIKGGADEETDARLAEPVRVAQDYLSGQRRGAQP